ncbi:hypothetical protein FBU30_000803 [Linnemannia zychae]|nr:hypothetical protein FBU30_000803 [Linnemannia zychae]
MDGTQWKQTAAIRRHQAADGDPSNITLRNQSSMRIQTRPQNPHTVDSEHQSTVRSEQQRHSQQQHDQEYYPSASSGDTDSGNSTLLSVQSDTSDRTVFDWQMQDNNHHYLLTHSTSTREIRHGKDKWVPPPPPPSLLDSLNSRPTNQQQQPAYQTRFWLLPSRNWPRQTRIWLRRYFGISRKLSTYYQSTSEQYSPYVTDDASLLSASSSISTLSNDKVTIYSRYRPYSEYYQHSGSIFFNSSRVTFLSSENIESAQFKNERNKRRSPRIFTALSRILSNFHDMFGRGGRNRMTSMVSPPASSATLLTCLKLSRRGKKTLYRWAGITLLMLVITLGIYITTLGAMRIRGYLSCGIDGIRKDRGLMTKGWDVWRKVAINRIGTVGYAGQENEDSTVHSGSTGMNSMKQGYVSDGVNSLPSTDAQLDQANSLGSMEDGIADPLDLYPDEEDDPLLEVPSFISWLSQASLHTLSDPQQNQQQQQPPPQQYDNSQGPPRKPYPSQAPSFESDRYFTYLPYAGISNQFYGMLRAMSIARALNRTLLLPPITSSSHDKSRQNQAWSEFFNLNEFRRRTGLRIIEYHELRDKGSFRGPAGPREPGTVVGASWIPPETKIESEKAVTSSEHKGDGYYQYTPEIGISAVDMTMPCYATCGFGSKRDLEFSAKAFLRQWGFQLKNAMLPKLPPLSMTSNPESSTPTTPIDNSPIDETRDFDRIVRALQDHSLREESFLCVSNTYKIQISATSIFAKPLIDSVEWQEFGQHLLFQPRLIQFVNEFLDRTFGEHPEMRTIYPNNTFGTRSQLVPDVSPLMSSTPVEVPAPALAPMSEQQKADSPQIVPLNYSITVANDSVSSSQLSHSQDSQLSPLPYAKTVDFTPWPLLRPLIQHTFFMIHVRRGDFEDYCKKTFTGRNLIQCLPSNEAYTKIIHGLQERALKANIYREGNGESRAQGIKRRRIPVLVATNENRTEELAQLRRLGCTHNLDVDKVEKKDETADGVNSQVLCGSGEDAGEEWIILDHNEMKTVEKLGVFGPMMVEQVLMAEAEVLLGVRMSTFSRVGGNRLRDWYQRHTIYVGYTSGYE